MNWKSTNDIAFAIATETTQGGEYGKGVSARCRDSRHSES